LQETRGVMHFGQQQIPTIERPRRIEGVDGIYCQEEGEYLCSWGFMIDHQVHHYRLEDRHGRTGIFIHKGTKVTDSLGCIISDPVSIGCLEAWIPDHGKFMLAIINGAS